MSADNTALHRAKLALTNDALIIATWLTNRRGPVRYEPFITVFLSLI